MRKKKTEADRITRGKSNKNHIGGAQKNKKAAAKSRRHVKSSIRRRGGGERKERGCSRGSGPRRKGRGGKKKTGKGKIRKVKKSGVLGSHKERWEGKRGIAVGAERIRS